MIHNISNLFRQLNLIIKIYLNSFRNRGFPMSEEYFNSMYKEGKWKHRSEERLERYTIIAGYCYYYKRGGSILDVGCGEGVLLDFLDYGIFSKYIGIDISRSAFEEVKLDGKHNAQFIRADIDTYVPNENFDIIVFIESIFYLKKPFDTLKHYEQFLRKDGFFIVSVYETHGSSLFWRKIKSLYRIVHEVKLVYRNISHKYAVLSPK